MSEHSAIEWTDATWNPVTGCSKVSPGCAHCYAETVAGRFWPQQYVHTVERGFISVSDYNGDRMDGCLRQFTDVMTHEDRLDQPLHWRKPRRIFVNSMSDLFHEDVPDAFIDRVFAVMALAPQHTFQVLTKRAERMRGYVAADSRHDAIVAAMDMPSWLPAGRRFLRVPENWPLPNVWLGVSVENQHFADERIPLLLQTPAAVRFISAEPLLGLIDFGSAELRRNYYGHLDWVIVGGESGPSARPFDLAWARSIVQQCQAAGVPVFVKQLGAHVRGPLKGCLVDQFEMPDGEWRRLPIIVTPSAQSWVAETRTRAVGARLFNKKGGDPSEWPEDLRVRQFPEAHA